MTEALMAKEVGGIQTLNANLDEWWATISAKPRTRANGSAKPRRKAMTRAEAEAIMRGVEEDSKLGR